jgi:hypothetical protein
VTFVDTVLALTFAADLAQFIKNILAIRYSHLQIDYTQRTDWFTDLEWNPTLRRLGFINDITLSIVDRDKQAIAKLAETIINKPEWYAKKIALNLDLPNLPNQETEHRLRQLQSEGKKFIAEASALTYLPLTKLLNSAGHPDKQIWDQFPNVAVIEIVRPNWRPVNPKDKSTDYGTHLNVSHMGIATRTATDILFYHAASGKAVTCLPLVDYLRSFIDDQRPAPVRGIHIEEILK